MTLVPSWPRASRSSLFVAASAAWLLSLGACALPPVGPAPLDRPGTGQAAAPLPPLAVSSAPFALASSAPPASAAPAASALAPSPPASDPEALVLPPPNEALDRTARLLAGLDAEASWLGDAKVVTRHAQAATRAFTAFDDGIGKAMRSWADRHLTQQAGDTVFYPFAGPDFITAHRFYPLASRYVLVALQEGAPAPALASLSSRELDRSLRVYERALDAFARRGFFITAQLGAGYHTPRAARGISGMLLAFAAREGFEVRALTPVRIREDGSALEPHPGDRALAETWSSVRLSLRRLADGAPVIVDYLQLDLSDQGLGNTPGALALLTRTARGPTLLKAASHLPQQQAFSRLRALLLAGPSEIVQDETGLPYADLAAGHEVQLFGDLRAVNQLFDGRPQRALREAYARQGSAGELPFPIGYRKVAGSSLQVARRKAP
jgi:hypothetical protein